MIAAAAHRTRCRGAGDRRRRGRLRDTDHTAGGGLRDPARHAEWLRAVRRAASADGYPLVINARVDVFVGPFLAGAGPGT
jgi:hypothetical protein